MTLTTHAIVGAAAAKIFSFHPVLAGVAAFASHFIIDAIPHWDYIPRSFQDSGDDPLHHDMEVGKHFFYDALMIGADAMLGVALSLIIFPPENMYSFLIVFIGACLGILPDPLQFVYWKWRHEPIVSLQRFHLWIHTSHRKWTKERRWMIGVVTQTILVGIILTTTKLLTKFI